MSFEVHRSLLYRREGVMNRQPYERRERATMGQPVVHFEIIGSDPAKLRSYYGELFGWEFDIGDSQCRGRAREG
jgi:hypothetical protein